jgi:hypothetical protein
MRRLLAAVLTAFVAAPSAFAAETMYGNDPNRELKEEIEDTYGMYILNPSRRHPKEKIEVNGENVEIWLYHDPRKADFDKLKCDAIKWLLLGRFGKGGAQPFFAAFPKFNAVELDMFQLTSSRTVDAAGRYTVTKTPRTVLKVKLTRKRSEKTDYAAIAKEFTDKYKSPDDAAACVKSAEKMIDAKFYNKEFFK